MDARHASPGWRDPLVAAGIAVAVSALYASGEVGLGDTDPPRHLEYAHQLWLSHFTLRGHPFLPLTTLGDSGADLWLGFHWLLVPFSLLGRVAGGRLAGACFAAIHAAILAALLGRAGVRRAWLFAAAPIVLSALFAIRDHLARPSHLALAMLYLNLWAGAGWLRPRAAALASFAHGLLHLSSPLSPVFCAIGWGGGRAAGRRVDVGSVMWSLAGLALAYLARPDRDTFLPAALSHNLVALGGQHAGTLPDRALELMRPSWDVVATSQGALVLLVLVAIALGWRRARVGPRELCVGAAVALVLSVGLTLQAARFLEFVAPFLAILAALLWPVELVVAPRWRRLGLAIGALGSIAIVGWGASDAWALSRELTPPESAYEELAKDIRARVPPGSMLFTDDLFHTAELWSHLPEYRFIVAYDPAILFGRSPARYWRWHHLVSDGMLCDEEACADAAPDPAAIAAGIRSFGAQWVVLWYPRPTRSLAWYLGRAPALFELAAQVKAPHRELQLWRVREEGTPGSAGDGPSR